MEITIKCSEEEILRVIDRIRVIDPRLNDADRATVAHLARMNINDVLSVCDELKIGNGCSDG